MGTARRDSQGIRRQVGSGWILGVSVLITLCVIGAQQVLHHHMEERNEPGPLLHLARDGALALPMVLLAVALTALPVVRRRAARIKCRWR